jgi:DNA-directed RNA polymerase beta' subunit
LGQQNLLGQRVPPVLNHNTRTLPHYPSGSLPLEIEYESRGFIASSFIKGLNPKEFYFHAMSGREGICDKICVTKRRLERVYRLVIMTGTPASLAGTAGPRRPRLWQNTL